MESAHRYVIQKRVNLTGSRLTVENANDMLAINRLRDNDDRQFYWLNLNPENSSLT